MARTASVRGIVVVVAAMLIALVAVPLTARAQDVSHLELLLQFVNEARQANGASPVSMEAQLNAAALRHSTDMAGGEFLSHTGTDGSSFAQRVQDTGYRMAAGAENVLFQLDLDASEAFNYWFASPEHRANLLNRAYIHAGIGYARSGSGKYYYTLILATPDYERPPQATLEGNVAPGVNFGPTPQYSVSDNRLNEAGLPPVAVYCAPGGGVTVWKIDFNTSQGSQVIYASPAQIRGALAQSASAGTPTQIASYADISLWALSGSDLQVNSGYPAKPTPYTFSFKAERCGVAAASGGAVLPAQATPLPPQTAVLDPPAGSGVYVVQPGDTLFRIALRYGLTTSQLAVANGISNPSRIYAGQTLVIPGVSTSGTATGSATSSRTHLVQPGETLYLIALRYGVPLSQLAAANGITNTWLIYAGEVLVIP